MNYISQLTLFQMSTLDILLATTCQLSLEYKWTVSLGFVEFSHF